MDNSLETLLEEIYADSKITPAEIKTLREHGERAMINLLSLTGDEGTTNALCKSFEVTNQLLQETLLKAKRKKASAETKEALAALINSQIELLKANNPLFG